MPYELQATKEQIAEGKCKCWWTTCNKTAHFQAWTGWRFCFKHWRQDYIYGSGHGLWFALKHTAIINLNRF